MEPNRAEAYVQKLKELNAYMESMILRINQNVNRLENARMESRKHFEKPAAGSGILRATISPELILGWEQRVN